MLTATVSGSFHRHMGDIGQAVNDLLDLGVRVLSPADPRVVDQMGDFLFVASDRMRSVRLVQDRHLECILASDFLWLVAPDGYVGQSASMEVGFAVANGVSIFSTGRPGDLTLRQYVHQVGHMRLAVEAMTSRVAVERRQDTFLIDPRASIERAHTILERLHEQVMTSPGEIAGETDGRIRAGQAEIVALVGLPR